MSKTNANACAFVKSKFKRNYAELTTLPKQLESKLKLNVIQIVKKDCATIESESTVKSQKSETAGELKFQFDLDDGRGHVTP